MVTRRQFISHSAVATIASITGCIGDSERDRLAEEWERQDQYPNDDYRNREVPVPPHTGDYSTGMMPSPIPLIGRASDHPGSDYTYDVTIESDEPVNVFLTPDEQHESLLEGKEVERFPDYTENEMHHVEFRVSVPDGTQYELYVVSPDYEPGNHRNIPDTIDYRFDVEAFYYVEKDEWVAHHAE